MTMIRHRLAAEPLFAPSRLAGLAIAAAAALSPLSTAAAQDSEPAPAPAEKPDIALKGFRIELLAGFDDSSFDHGLLYGARVGYDFRVAGRVSLGLDAELTDPTTKQDIKPFSNIVVHDGPDLYLGARASFALSRRFSLHGAAGYTHARLGHYELAPGNVIVGVEQNYNGYRLSAGGQFRLGRHAFVGAEYRYTNYDTVQMRDQYVATIGFRF
jgi:outer membrane immunogenic protein